MTKDEALEMAIEHIEHNGATTERKMILQACKEALAQPEQEPDYWLGYGLQAHDEKPFEGAIPLYTHPAPSQWISVKDRLPNDMDRVAFVAISQHDYLNGKTFGGVYNKLNDLFYTPGLGLIATHWMPLPDAPKESNND